jgi:phosphosulfolactate synthase (CoM biosynthesis protein A)
MSMKEKARYIRELAKEFTVLSEVGSKDSEKIIPPYRWVELIQADPSDRAKRAPVWSTRSSPRSTLRT